MKNKKALGQNWLKDRAVLDAMVDFAGITEQDRVLEIGPGLGTLTSALLRRAAQVTAVEYDVDLANKLPAQFPGKNLTVFQQDILQFDLSSLARDYKVVANLPYYITSKIIMFLLLSQYRPSSITILVQKEVAERIAQIGGSSVLALAVENWAEVKLGEVVPAELFTPVPQVDSQIIRLDLRPAPLVADDKLLMRVIKAAFSQKRKKLKSSLSAGLVLDKAIVEEWLISNNINPDSRAQELGFTQWRLLSESLPKLSTKT